MSDKLILLISGANQGIGFQAAKQLAATRKYIVLLGSRDLEKGNKAVEDILADKDVSIDRANIDAIQLDLSDDKSIQTAVEVVEKKYDHLDIVGFHGLSIHCEPSVYGD